MKSILKKWTESSLILKIVAGLVIGAVLGLLFPKASFFGIPGTLFIGALKAIAPILVFLLVSSAIAQAVNGIGSRFRTVIILYLFSTFLAAICAVAVSRLFPVKIILSNIEAYGETPAPSGLKEIFEALLGNMVQNPIKAIAEGNYLGILFWAIVLGVALKAINVPDTVKNISNLSDAVSRIVSWVIQFAPFGVMGIMYTNISTNGLEIFVNYGQLILMLVGTMAFVALVINPAVVWFLLKKNPYPLIFRCLKESGVSAFFTRSSAANIPVNMKLCEELGLDKDFYSVSIPLGSTINMEGAAVTITVMSLAAANTLGLSIPLPLAIILSIVSTLGAAGTSGVAGGSLLLIPMACSLMGISNDIAMEVVAVGFIIGVIQDSVETALNSSSDAVFTATAEFYDRAKAEKKGGK
ncbi:MAG: serine/threonine transporter SstT [Lachnospiraceae bacterium]|nr:serine/threonine transporter SstT [Candidatus Hippenecus merdae]